MPLLGGDICRGSIQNRPVMVESKPATFYYLNRGKIFWQVWIVGWADRPVPEGNYVLQRVSIAEPDFVFDFGSEERASNKSKAKYSDALSAERKRAQDQNGINGGSP